MRFLLPIFCTAALAVGGCASPEKQAQKAMARMERERAQENSRAVESRRMKVLDNGDVASQRGAEILVLDPAKTFDPAKSGIGTVRTTATGGARTKEFNFDQKTHPGSFLTRMFAGSKSNTGVDRKFATNDARTRGYNTGEASDATKNAATRNAWDANKTAATRAAANGNRQFLGTEKDRMGNSVDPKTLANWRLGGETVNYTDHTVEQASTFKQLTIDDVRELLNKNK